MAPAIQHGYLVLADLSGYTPFMAESELDHAQGILRNVFSVLLGQMTPTLSLAEIEGDAVFAFVPSERLTRGELLLEVIEATYVAFRQGQRTMSHNATCPCNACRLIGELGLKFVVHYGPFVLSQVAGREKPVGSSVNLVHRLLKNDVRETTGWRGYALFTEESLAEMGVGPAGMHASEETYEHLGTVRLRSLDLDARYRAYTSERRVYLAEEEADFTLVRRFAAPPASVWDWLNDPDKRNRWMEGSAWAALDRPYGRTGPVATNHCTNSRFIEHILDWQPFHYYTVRYARGRMSFLITGELTPDGAGTRVRWSIRLEGRLPRPVLGVCCRFIADRMMRIGEGFDAMEQLMQRTLPAAPAALA